MTVLAGPSWSTAAVVANLAPLQTWTLVLKDSLGVSPQTILFAGLGSLLALYYSQPATRAAAAVAWLTSVLAAVIAIRFAEGYALVPALAYDGSAGLFAFLAHKVLPWALKAVPGLADRAAARLLGPKDPPSPPPTKE